MKVCRFCWKPVKDELAKCPDDGCTVFHNSEESLRGWARDNKNIFIIDTNRFIINMSLMEIDKYYKFSFGKQILNAKLNKDNSLEIMEE